MRWPWVSRRALEIREQQVQKLEADLAKLQEKYDDLDNQFIFRGTGVAKDPDKLPLAFRKKVNAVEPAAVQSPDNPRIIPNVRDRIKEAEEKLARDFVKAQRTVIPMPSPVKEANEATQ